jgi:DNA-directed RNA polymerase specialized sigma subunit
VSNYINNKRFEELIKLHCSGDHSQDEELMQSFDALISNIIDAFHFKVDKEDAKQDCFLLILRTLRNFNPKNGSAFNYFTTVIVNNLKLVATKIKRHKLKLESYFQFKFGINVHPLDPSSY